MRSERRSPLASSQRCCVVHGCGALQSPGDAVCCVGQPDHSGSGVVSDAVWGSLGCFSIQLPPSVSMFQRLNFWRKHIFWAELSFLCGGPGLAFCRAGSQPEDCVAVSAPFFKPLITGTVILQWSLASSPLNSLLQQSKTADTAFILLSNLSMQTSFCSSFTLYFEERHYCMHGEHGVRVGWWNAMVGKRHLFLFFLMTLISQSSQITVDLCSAGLLAVLWPASRGYQNRN